MAATMIAASAIPTLQSAQRIGRARQPTTRARLYRICNPRPAPRERVKSNAGCESRKAGPRGFRAGFGPMSGGFCYNTPSGTNLDDMLRDMQEEWSKWQSYDPATRSPYQSFLALPVDVVEEADAFLFFADVPGLAKGDIKVQVNKGSELSISGERRAPAELSGEDKSFRKKRERRFGKFQRTFQLPDSADASKISATTNNGVLIVTVRKTAPAEPQVTEVPIWGLEEEAAAPERKNGDEEPPTDIQIDV